MMTMSSSGGYLLSATRVYENQEIEPIDSNWVKLKRKRLEQNGNTLVVHCVQIELIEQNRLNRLELIEQNRMVIQDQNRLN